jgi:hypothetical protein
VGAVCGQPTMPGSIYCGWHTTRANAEGRPTS